jgi:hypothetical protein
MQITTRKHHFTASLAVWQEVAVIFVLSLLQLDNPEFPHRVGGINP